MIQMFEQDIPKRIHNFPHLRPVPFLPIFSALLDVRNIFIQPLMNLLMFLEMIALFGKLWHPFCQNGKDICPIRQTI
jgi:hypothetical protein